MAYDYTVYLLKFEGTPLFGFNDFGGTAYGAKVDAIIDGAPLLIRENIEEIAMSNDAVDTADGELRPTSIVLKGKVWHPSSAKLTYTACMAIRTLCLSITAPGWLRIYWKVGGSNLIGYIDHCSDFDWHGLHGMRVIEYEATFTVLEPTVAT